MGRKRSKCVLWITETRLLFKEGIRGARGREKVNRYVSETSNKHWLIFEYARASMIQKLKHLKFVTWKGLWADLGEAEVVLYWMT